MKIIDITEKLNFEERPKLIIKGEEYPVNNDVVSVLKIIEIQTGSNDMTPGDVITMYECLFDKETRDKINTLKLSFKNFQVLIESASTLAVGEETVGEQCPVL